MWVVQNRSKLFIIMQVVTTGPVDMMLVVQPIPFRGSTVLGATRVGAGAGAVHCVR
jgi:hypothetical protein